MTSKKYSEKEILALAAALSNDEQAYNWLAQDGAPELSALTDVLYHGKSDALTWLEYHGFTQLTAFINALAEDDSARDLLASQAEGKIWAAISDYVNDSDEAGQWILHSPEPYYASIANVLRKNDEGGAILGRFNPARRGSHGFTLIF